METILFIVEGAKAESKVIDNIKQFFLSDKIVIKILYGTSIYHLYKKISEDEDFDIVEILREMSSKNREILKGIKRRYITSIFLFFDQDSHTTNASEKALGELIKFFDNEMERGQLYVSYPMVEALRDIDNLDEKYEESLCLWNIENNLKYKAHASNKIRDVSFLSVYEEYDDNIWEILNRYNWLKGNFLINDLFDLPDYNKLIGFTQEVIYEKQCRRKENIVVLSAFPFFIANYLKKEKIINMLR